MFKRIKVSIDGIMKDELSKTHGVIAVLYTNDVFKDINISIDSVSHCGGHGNQHRQSDYQSNNFLHGSILHKYFWHSCHVGHSIEKNLRF